MGDLARLQRRASTVGQLRLCPGSGQIEMPVEEDSEAATEGTLLHEAIARVIDLPGNADECGHLHLNEEQCDAVTAAYESLGDTTDSYFETEVTLPLELDQVGGANYPAFGHADVVRTFEDSDYAEVTDWKFGRGDLSPTSIRDQLQSYAAGVFQQRPGIQTLKVTVNQVRLERVYEQEYSREELPNMLADIQSVLADSDAPGAELRPSRFACRYCDAKAVCPALQEVGQDVALRSHDTLPTAPQELDTLWERVGLAGKALEGLKRRVRAELLLGKGTRYGSVQKRGSRTIGDPVGLYQALKGVAPHTVGLLDLVRAGTYSMASVQQLSGLPKKEWDEVAAPFLNRGGSYHTVAQVKEEGIEAG